MIIERMLELLILKSVLEDYDRNNSYKKYLNKNYNISKLEDRYAELGIEFLTQYAIDKTKRLD